MNGLLPEGENLRFEGLEQPLQIQRALGGGSQGQVFAVRLGSERLALKWYFPACINRDPQLRERLQQSIRLGAPNHDFLWPLAVLEPTASSASPTRNQIRGGGTIGCGRRMDHCAHAA